MTATSDPAATADGGGLRIAAESINQLRAVSLALETAVTYASEHLTGARHHDARCALDNYEGALYHAWETYGDVHDTVTASRAHLPGSAPVTVASILSGLRIARHQAAQAAAHLPAIRHRLASAADRLQRSDDPHGRAAGTRLSDTIDRLDRLATSLAVGARAINRYLDALDTGTDPPQTRRARFAARRPVARPDAEAGAVAARAATGALRTNQKHIHYRTSWQLFRRDFWTTFKRQWRL